MLAIYQGAPAFQAPNRNLAKLRELARAASDLESRVLLLPELFLTGYNLRDHAFELAQPRDGQLISSVCEIAAQQRIAIVVGFPERDGQAVYNTVAAVGADGHPKGFYRKVHLFGPDENRIFRPGSELALIDLPIGRAGLAICYDIEFPEVARAFAEAGAELILVPSANMLPYWAVPTTLIRARSLENGIAIAYANLAGVEDDLEFTGLSAIVGPDGQDLARAGPSNEALLTVGHQDLTVPPDELSTQLHDLRRDRLAVRAAAA